MLTIIKNTVKIIDRNVLNVIPFSDSINLPSSGFSRFVMANGKIEAENSTIKGTFSASINTEFTISGKGVIIETPGNFFREQKFCTIDPLMEGQLCYIDGCSNTNLVDPMRNGDPCLNYLFFPKDIDQTFHTHPSVRIGFIISGKGYASLNNREIPLEEGNVFILDRHAKHRFHTSDSHMSLMVFHPDSEDGPRDEFNPMKSRTYLK